MKKDLKGVEIPEVVTKVIDSLEEKKFTSVWMSKENVKILRSLLEEKYTDFKIDKLSGSETQFISVSIK
jgi:hypothetical protein